MKRVLAVVLGLAACLWSPAGVAGNDKPIHREDERPKGLTATPFVVVDANEKIVGKYGGGAGLGFVQFRLDNATVAVFLQEQAGFISPGRPDYLRLMYADSAVYFRETDCTGLAYGVGAPGVGIRQALTVTDSMLRVWLYQLDGQPNRGALIRSAYQHGSCTPNMVPNPGFAGELFSVIAAPVEITGMFTLPFVVK